MIVPESKLTFAELPVTFLKMKQVNGAFSKAENPTHRGFFVHDNPQL
jgi:hypothetical protein